MEYNKRNDCNKINSMPCMRIYHIPGPQGQQTQQDDCLNLQIR